jgi:lipopolysaccharide export system protein LptA
VPTIASSSRLIAAAALLLLVVGGVHAAEPRQVVGTNRAAGQPKQAGGQKQEPISITSERMEANTAGDIVTFTGDVVATQADGVLKAKVVKVYYHSVPGSGAAPAGTAKAGAAKESRREIDRIEADGDVIIVRGVRTAVGEHAVYTAADRTIVLTGKPRLRQERDWISGNKVTVYLDEDRSIVDGAPGRRVQSTIYPQDQRQGGAKAPSKAK